MSGRRRGGRRPWHHHPFVPSGVTKTFLCYQSPRCPTRGRHEACATCGWPADEHPAAADRCLVCAAPLLGDVIRHMDLGIATHAEACHAIVTAARRTTERSRRGRWRTRAEVLRCITGAGTLLRELDALEHAG